MTSSGRRFECLVDPALKASSRYNRDIVLATVKQNGDALRWASEDLQQDPDIVLLKVLDKSPILLEAHSIRERSTRHDERTQPSTNDPDIRMVCKMR